jgi:hypothetical protein
MADTKQLTDKELAELVANFQNIQSHDEKCRFFHAHPELHAVIRGQHFPDPEKATK